MWRMCAWRSQAMARSAVAVHASATTRRGVAMMTTTTPALRMAVTTTTRVCLQPATASAATRPRRPRKRRSARDSHSDDSNNSTTTRARSAVAAAASSSGRPHRGNDDDDAAHVAEDETTRSAADDDDDDDHNDSDHDSSSSSTMTPATDTTHSKRLVDVCPSLAAEYKAAGAANTVPVDAVAIDSAVVATWQCASCGQPWRCGVFVRTTLRNVCPHCGGGGGGGGRGSSSGSGVTSAGTRKTLATVRPELVQMWDATVNDPFVSPATLPADSTLRASWRCDACGQSFQARVRDVVSGKARCTSCALSHTHSVDDLAQVQQALQHEWHPLRNGDLHLEQLSTNDHKTRVWWLCSQCGHDWQATLAARLSRHHRAHGRVCPACRGRGSLSS